MTDPVSSAIKVSREAERYRAALYDRYESEIEGIRKVTLEESDAALSQPGAIDLRTDEQRRRDRDEIRRRQELRDQR